MKKSLLICFVALLASTFPACSWLGQHPQEVADLEKVGVDVVKAVEDAVAPAPAK